MRRRSSAGPGHSADIPAPAGGNARTGRIGLLFAPPSAPSAIPKVCWTASPMGATIKPHPVFDTVKGAAVATYLPVGSAAAPAYFDVGALQRIGPIPATSARRKTPIKPTTCIASTPHPGWRMPLAISPPYPSPRLFLCARSGAQEQKSPESSTPCNQNRAIKARKQRFLTTVHRCISCIED